MLKLSMRKFVGSAVVLMTLAVGVVGYAAMRPRPKHCARTAAARAARAAQQNGGVRIVSAIDHGHHHHGGSEAVIVPAQIPIPDCLPCDDCECGFWTRFWHCGM